jgi:hypothetical protein
MLHALANVLRVRDKAISQHKGIIFHGEMNEFHHGLATNNLALKFHHFGLAVRERRRSEKLSQRLKAEGEGSSFQGVGLYAGSRGDANLRAVI